MTDIDIDLPPRRTVYVPVDQVARANRNPRTHDLTMIANSIRRFGFVDGAVHDGRTDRIIAGHGRLESLQAMHEAGEAAPDGIINTDGAWLMPVQMGWASRSDQDAEALLVVLNRATEVARWDERELSAMLSGLDGDLLALSGFTQENLDEMLDRVDTAATAAAGGASTDLDDAPDPPATPFTVAGDVWQLGRHRVVCGDSTEAADVAKAVDGRLVQAVWTDPPYGVSYVGKTKDALTIDNDTLEHDDLSVFLGKAFDAALTVCEPGAVWYVAAPPGPATLAFAQELGSRGLWRQTIAWVKDALVLGRSDYHYKHEILYYGFVPGAQGRRGRGGAGWYGDNSQTTVWEFPKPRRSAEHPTMKPVDLIVHSLRNSTTRSDLVLDVFGGSGSTLIACETTGRTAAIVELSPQYVDVICRRYQQATGDLPVLERTGETHDFTVTAVGDEEPVEGNDG